LKTRWPGTESVPLLPLIARKLLFFRSPRSSRIWHKFSCRLISCPSLENKNSAVVAGGAVRWSLNSNATSVGESQSVSRLPITEGASSYPELVFAMPDICHISRQARTIELARELDLRLDGTSKIHCWHPDRHKHGDRTASVGIRTNNNTVKCFGCGSKPIGPIDPGDGCPRHVRSRCRSMDCRSLHCSFHSAVPACSETACALLCRVRERDRSSHPLRAMGNTIRSRAMYCSCAAGNGRERRD